MNLKSMFIGKAKTSKAGINRAATAKQSGATLLEALSFLAISAIIVVGATSLLKVSFSNSDTNAHARELTAIRTNVKSFLGSSGGYGTTSLNATLITANLIPSTMSVSSPTINNNFGGTVTVTGATSTFTVVTTGLPQENCIKVIPMLAGYTSYTVGSGTSQTSFTGATAAAQCVAANATGGTYTLTLAGQ